MSNPSDAHVHHTIDYIEFSVPNLAEQKAFYERALGWAFTDYGPGYSGIQGRDKEQGGVAQADQPAPPLVVLYSKDLAATLDAVVAAGGSVTKEPFDFPGGRRFHFVDPAGTELAVWTLA